MSSVTTNMPSEGRIGRTVGRLREFVRRYRTYLRTMAELETLSSRELADLGISKLEIRSVAYRAAFDL